MSRWVLPLISLTVTGLLCVSRFLLLVWKNRYVYPKNPLHFPKWIFEYKTMRNIHFLWHPPWAASTLKIKNSDPSLKSLDPNSSRGVHPRDKISAGLWRDRTCLQVIPLPLSFICEILFETKILRSDGAWWINAKAIVESDQRWRVHSGGTIWDSWEMSSDNKRAAVTVALERWGSSRAHLLKEVSMKLHHDKLRTRPCLLHKIHVFRRMTYAVKAWKL